MQCIVAPTHASRAGADNKSGSTVQLADAVVYAALWSDAQAEFVYGDGTVMSFGDAMRTIVTVHCADTKRRSGDTVSNEDGGSNGAVRDMCFTAWTLSTYVGKVSAALAVYNRFAAQPRVYGSLPPRQGCLTCANASSSSCSGNVGNAGGDCCDDDGGRCVHVWWRAPASLQQLVLAKHSSYFVRRHCRDDGCCCCAGTACTLPELVLTCVHRRVTLTVHASRATFDVRWPVPIKYDDDGGGGAACTRASSSSLSSLSSLLLLHSLRGRHDATHYVWLRQVFTVAAPPDAWLRMLRFALELDAELPPCVSSSPSSPSASRHAQRRQRQPPAPPPPVLQLYTSSLPCNVALQDDEQSTTRAAPGAAGVTKTTTTAAAAANASCHFSPLQLRDAHHLVACASSLHALQQTRPLHRAGATVRWCLSCDASLQQPHAMYWCVPRASSSHVVRRAAWQDASDAEAAVPSSSSLLLLCGDGNGSNIDDNASGEEDEEVLALVREDGSVVRVGVHGSGYAVTHKMARRRRMTPRCAATAVAGAHDKMRDTCVYFMRADGRVGLPPRVPVPLTASVVSVGMPTPAAAATTTRAMQRSDEVCTRSCSGELRDSSDDDKDVDDHYNDVHATALSAVFDVVADDVAVLARARPVMCGRYLAAVAHAAMRLLQCNRAAVLCAQQQQQQQGAVYTSATITTRRHAPSAVDAAAPRAMTLSPSSPLPLRPQQQQQQQQQRQANVCNDKDGGDGGRCVLPASVMTTHTSAASLSPLPLPPSRHAHAVALHYDNNNGKDDDNDDYTRRAYAQCVASRNKLQALLRHSAQLARRNRVLLHDDDT